MATRRAALLGLLTAGCSPRASNDLVAADVHRKDYPTVEAVRWMGDELSRATGGRLRLRLFASGQIGAEDDALGLARMGAIDFARVNAAALNNRVPATRLLCLPYVIESTEHLHRVVDSEVGAAIRASFAGSGLVALAIYDAGLRCVYNVRRPLRRPADLTGLKLRTPQSDLFIKTVAALGANPTPLTVSYVFQALSTHLIDGAENNWPTFESARHVELAKYWSDTLHSASPEFLVMSQARFDRLAPADRALIADAAARSVPVMREKWAALEATAREAAIAQGAVVVDADRAAFRDATRRLVADEAEAVGKTEMLAQIRRFA